MAPSSYERELIGECSEHIAKLGTDELEVIRLLLRRTRQGQRQYGELEISTDGRNWVVQTLEECIDGLFYMAVQLIKVSRGMR